MKKGFGFFILILSFCSAVYAQSNLPRPTGHVSDFANLLNPTTKQSLETILKEYRDKTSIEIAVVTVSSLEGLTVEEYTLNLAQKWGVGDKEKDNGIVLLVAPNERKMRIEVGYGMEPDLTDGSAGRIIRDTITPYFKESVQLSDQASKNAKLTEGIVAGVGSILNHLGDKPYQTRIEERRLFTEKAAAEQKLRDEKTAAFFKSAGIVVLILVPFAIGGVAIYRINARRKYLGSVNEKNIKGLKECGRLIEEAKKELPKAVETLAFLQNGNPKSVWQDLEKEIDGMPKKIQTANESLDSLIVKRLELGWQGSEKLIQEMGSLLVTASVLSGVLEKVEARITEIKDARTRSPKMIDTVADSIEKTKKELSHLDVKDSTRGYVDEAREKHKRAKAIADDPSVNWLTVLSLLTAAVALLNSAKSRADSDKEEAEEIRHPKPKPRRSSYDSEYSSGWSSGSSHDSGSSGSSSSSFDFGGGSFGGGGASGSW